jgi:hypothetical protein
MLFGSAKRGKKRPAAGRQRRLSQCAVVIAVVGAAVWVAAPGASAAPTACAPAPFYGIGVAIIPEFVGTNDVAVTAFPGEVIDYDVTVFLRQDAPGTPNGVLVCPIFGGTLTVTLPDGSGPFTLATGLSLPVGGSVSFEDVPSQKYSMNQAHALTAPGCEPFIPCYDRVTATAHVVATSQGPDSGPQDDAPVQATATAPTFLLAPSTLLTVTASSPAVNAGDPVEWTITETNDTPPRFFPLPLTAVHVDLSTDGGVSTFGQLGTTSSGFTGDTNGDSELDVGETWRWTITSAPTGDTTLTATGFGTGPRGRVLTFPGDPEERSAATVLVTPVSPPPPPSSPSSPSQQNAEPPPPLAPLAPTPQSPLAPTPNAPVIPGSFILPETGTPRSSVMAAITAAITVVLGSVLMVIGRRRDGHRV